MGRSDTESESEVFNIAEAQDLFYDEADEDRRVFKEDEAEEEPVKLREEQFKTKVENKPKRKRKRATRSRGITHEILSKSNGLPALKKLFEKFKFKGTGHEEEDLTRIMAVLQWWMHYQLWPSYDFETCMSELEKLGKKRIVQTLMKKYRLGIDDWGEKKLDDVDQDKQDDGVDFSELANKSYYDLLLDEEIANADSDPEFSLPEEEDQQSPQKETEVVLTPEQLERIARNRKLAIERRMKRMNWKQSTVNEESTSANYSEVIPMEMDCT